MFRRLAWLTWVWACLWGGVQAQGMPPQGLQPIPPLEYYLTDTAGVVGAAARGPLLSRLEDIHKRLCTQVVVLVVKTTQPETVEQYATRTFEKWKVGQAGKDNGVLFLVAINDRRMRIEVGYGLESVITDVAASRILDERVTPPMREGAYVRGIEAGVDGIADALRQREPSGHGAQDAVTPCGASTTSKTSTGAGPMQPVSPGADVSVGGPANMDVMPTASVAVPPAGGTAAVRMPGHGLSTLMANATWLDKLAVLIAAAGIFRFVPPVIGGLVGGIAVTMVFGTPTLGMISIFLLGFLHYRFIPRAPGASLGFDWLFIILVFFMKLLFAVLMAAGRGGGRGGGRGSGRTSGGGGRSGGGGASGGW